MMQGGTILYEWSLTSPLLWIFMLLLWWGILGVACLVHRLPAGRPGPGEEETPVNILTVRYIRGAISLEEFVKMKNDLERAAEKPGSERICHRHFPVQARAQVGNGTSN